MNRGFSFSASRSGRGRPPFLFFSIPLRTATYSSAHAILIDSSGIRMSEQKSREIVSAHSPDSDDAFMFYGLATKKIRSSRVTFRHVLSDIETLNRKALEGFYDLTAISY